MKSLLVSPLGYPLAILIVFVPVLSETGVDLGRVAITACLSVRLTNTNTFCSLLTLYQPSSSGRPVVVITRQRSGLTPQTGI